MNTTPDLFDELNLPPVRTIDGLELRLTCEACPEQYDVYDGETQVGYLRLRHGQFRAEIPRAGGRIIYVDYPVGDGFFESNERDLYLAKAVEAIRKHTTPGDANPNG